MKLKRVAVVLAALAVLMAGCGKDAASGSNSASAVSPALVAEEMMKAVTPQGEMLEVADSVLDNYYTIELEKTNGHKAYISTSFIAEEIAVFGAQDDSGADVKKMLEQRLQDLKDSFDGYLPEELASLEENAKILENNGYYCLLAGDTAFVEAAEKVFNEQTK